MRKRSSVVHIGEGKRKRRYSSSVEEPSIPEEKNNVHKNSMQSDMVKYMMNEILCGEKNESLATSLSSMEKACRNVSEAMGQKAMADGHDAACIDFMHSIWSTVQYCMVRFLIDSRTLTSCSPSLLFADVVLIPVVHNDNNINQSK